MQEYAALTFTNTIMDLGTAAVTLEALYYRKAFLRLLDTSLLGQ